jgi:hypothetical protein
MIKATTGVTQAGADVFRLKIRQFLHDLFRRQTVGEEIEDIADANPHAADTWAPSALFRIDGDALSHDVGMHDQVPVLQSCIMVKNSA